MTELSVDQQVAAFLAVCKTASLATVDAAGSPCNANVQYVSDDAWRLYWVSSVSSLHSVNLGAKPQAAVTIYAHRDEPEQVHGVQIRGTVCVLDHAEAERALSLYMGKYPFVAEPPFRGALGMQRLYRFTPTWLRWIDNRQGFGYKRELNLPGGPG